MSCDDVLKLSDLETAKKHDDFHTEVITGKSLTTGANIDHATNAVTGQVQKTLPKAINELGGMGYARVGTFATGATLTTARQTLLWDIADGGDGQEYGWSGTFPKVVPAGSTPSTTGGIGGGKWLSRFDPELRGDWDGFTAELLAQAGVVDDGEPDVLGDSKRVDSMRKIFTNTGTVADIAAGTFKPGCVVAVSDRDFELFEIVSGGVADGMGVLDAHEGNTAIHIHTASSTVDAYGANEIRSDNQLPINYMVSKVGYFKLAAKRYKISDQILLNGNSLTYGSKWSGEGKERSFIECVGMTGKSAIRAGTGTLIRVTMCDLKIDGDCDSAINLDSEALVYQSSFERLWTNSQAGSCIFIKRPFSTTLRNVEAGSSLGHAFESTGGNTFKLDTCYAHKVGENKSGFRIYGKASLHNCNGIDETSGNRWWGWFGNATTGNSYNVTITNSNLEDFGEEGALKFEKFGVCILNGSSFLPRATGTFQTLIQFDNGSNHRIFIDGACSVSSKGATLSGGSYIEIPTTLKTGISFSQDFPDFRSTTTALTYPMPNLSLDYSAYGVASLKVNNLYAEKDYSFYAPKIATITANTGSFSVTGFNTAKTANTLATTLTNLTGAADGLTLNLLVKDAYTTIKHNAGGAGRFILLAGTDIVATNGQSLSFVGNGSAWVQV